MTTKMKSDLDELRGPQWNDRVDLPTFLEEIAAQMRAGTWSPIIEACFLAKNMAGVGVDPETGETADIVTICRWGENDGLLSTETLKGVAEHSRTT